MPSYVLASYYLTLAFCRGLVLTNLRRERLASNRLLLL